MVASEGYKPWICSKESFLRTVVLHHGENGFILDDFVQPP